MLPGVDAELGGVLVCEGPADVVVAAHVVDPCGSVGQGVPMFERLLQEPPVACRQGAPQERHLQRVVAESALLRGDVLRDLVGVDDGLGLEDDGGRSDAQDGVEGLDEQVRLGQ
ncbi:Uncharacterised protein [Mycobacteroides abscessus subsp. abscessus]|nr:Uncharacterised protein [Mycobacteroides abscessus subsp. abscessus]